MKPAVMRWGWIALVAGGIGGLALAAQPWWEIVADAQGLALGGDVPASSAAGAVTLTGNSATAGLAAALATVCLVGTVFSLTLRRVGRRVLAGLLVLFGAGMAVLGGAHPRPGDNTIVEELRKSTLASSWTADATIWPWLYAVAGVLVTVGAVVVFAFAGHAARGERSPARFERTEDGIPDDADTDRLWQALNRGQDPTDSHESTSDSPDNR